MFNTTTNRDWKASNATQQTKTSTSPTYEHEKLFGLFHMQQKKIEIFLVTSNATEMGD